jgi:hypothetical protein
MAKSDDSIVGILKKIPDEFARGTSRLKQDLGIAPDPNQYGKTPEGEAISNSDFAKGARNYIRMQKDAMGIKADNDTYESKGGKVKAKKSLNPKRKVHPNW